MSEVITESSSYNTTALFATCLMMNAETVNRSLESTLSEQTNDGLSMPNLILLILSSAVSFLIGLFTAEKWRSRWTVNRGRDKRPQTGGAKCLDKFPYTKPHGENKPRKTTATSTAPTTTTTTNSTADTGSVTSPVPTSVNYHFTRRCNYQCGFCFHTAKTSYVLPLDDAKRGLKMLKEAGMEKVNFSGGEPFLENRGRYVGEMVNYCKQELKLPSVSIVSNGSLVREKWFKDYGESLDILAISCDSFDPETNRKIGRQHGQKDHVQSLRKVQEWCAEYKVAFKINTVVNTHNKNEDMVHNIMLLNPCRWKVFQCLVIDGENAGPDALRNAESFTVTDDDFDSFLERHKDVPFLVPESNELMRYSYLIVDEYMRFLDGGTKKASPSLLDVGVEAAIDTSKFDEAAFFKRGGKYVWSKADMKLDW